MIPHDIGWAIRALKQGEQVRRAGWRGKDKFLSVCRGERPGKAERRKS